MCIFQNISRLVKAGLELQLEIYNQMLLKLVSTEIVINIVVYRARDSALKLTH